MPRAFTERERKQIVQRLLEAGQKKFTAYGLNKISVEELAAAVGISKGAFYLFYESKEALLMDLREQAEVRYREQVLAVVDAPGLSARDRLYTIFKTAFTLWKTFPIFELFVRSDYALLARQIPLERLQEHLMSGHSSRSLSRAAETLVFLTSRQPSSSTACSISFCLPRSMRVI